ncbi:YdbH family protein [Pasteurella testudinis]|uniref:YdbH family protein n=1 Tax=Pasteurella testudinis TaxID=761 RepID=UPI00405A3FBD
MWKKCLAVCIAILLLLAATVVWLLFGNGIQTTANYFLAPDYHISLAEPIDIDTDGILLPQITVAGAQNSAHQACRLVDGEQIRLAWWQRKLTLEKVRLDYACLQQLMNQANESIDSQPFTLTRLFALLPQGEVEIAGLDWRNAEAVTYPQLQQLLHATTHARAVRQGSQLRLQLQATEQQDADTTRELANLDGILFENTLTAFLIYQPDEHQYNQVTLNAELADSFEQLPLNADLDYRWRSADMIIPQGGISLTWKEQQAQLQLYEVAGQEQHQLLDLPFDIKNGQLQVSKAQFNWAKDLPQPMNGFLDLDLQAEQPDRTFWNSFPLNINFRLSLLSSGDKGKGLIVIQGLNGKIDRQALQIPLQVNGEVKSFDSIFYTDLPMRIEGPLHDPILRFLSGSLLRMTGNTEYIDIAELRLPLAGVVVGQYGIKGRLQAILKGKTRQFERIDLRLDGRANEFIAGIHSIFNIRSAQEVPSRLSAAAATNRWNWNFWGYADIPSLRNVVSLRGRGFWHDNLINIQLLDGELGRFALPGVQVEPLLLSLSQTISWDYQQQRLSGALVVNTPRIQLDYGGQILKPDISVGIEGKDFSDLNLKSELTADRLGPIRLFSTYQQGALRGNVYWPQQSSNVFQPLFPKRWNWLIQRGSIRGQTAFSITPEKGLIAGGHIAIENGSIALPNGAISGINFSLPYRYQNQRFQLGVKEPVEVKIASLDNGVYLKDVSLQVQGYYPYTRKSPLSLTKLNLKLLGGELNVDKFSLPQHNPAYLRLSNIELSEILELMQYNQLEMVGKVNADLPFWIENSPCIICDGVIEQGSDWRIHLSDELISKIEQGGGITERILTNLMETMDVYDSNINVNLLQDGTGLMNAKIKANNALQNPIFLNYNHKENAFDLWQSINFGSELQQNLEYRLYQRREQ